ncbi:MAG TPA: S41 family peptidase, partial [Gemmataceae bacterium]|nr:S41 family peptidase [Gemmataceae bacterium]
IINELAGSGGDYLPWAFRRFKLGPLVGKRTWGGLVGIGGYPPLLDGGTVTAPHFAFWTPEGEWEVENRGVAPDIEVEHDPKAVRAGRDPQLEKAVQLVLEALEKNPLPKAKRPAYPNYHPKANAEGGLTPPAGVKDQSFHWPSFRGPGGSGIAEGQHPLPCRHNSVIVAAVMRWV